MKLPAPLPSPNRRWLGLALALSAACAPTGEGPPEADPSPPSLELHQEELFSAGGAYTNAWADFDRDGDLDLFVGFDEGLPNRLYRNEAGAFTDVAASVGLAETARTRGAAWGDVDGDGWLDLYIGLDPGPQANRLYRNPGDGGPFVDVAPELGVDLSGQTRQISWVDVDRDGKLDLFVAFRDQPNRLFLNTGTGLNDVSGEAGLDDSRKAVGALWFDFDRDGDLDLFVANQAEDPNALFRNDGGTFVDIAAEVGVAASNRPEGDGSVGPCLADHDSDGRMELYVANYGPSAFFRIAEGGPWSDLAPGLGLDIDTHAVSCAWGDYDNDGRPDLYVSGYLNGELNYPDHFFHNLPSGFDEVLSGLIRTHDADHGVQWADFDADGDLDLALADYHPDGGHHLFRNMLNETGGRSVQVRVVDGDGRHRWPGSEVRVLRASSSSVLGSGIVDTGSGYCSQNVMPVHIGVADAEAVDVEITVLTRQGRRSVRLAGIDPAAAPIPIEVRIDPDGTLLPSR